MRAADADDVVAAFVEGFVGLGGLVDGIAEDLSDTLGCLVLPSGSRAKGGAAAINAKGACRGEKGGSDSHECGEGCGGVHDGCLYEFGI